MLTRSLAFARGLLRRRAIAREVDEELAFHLDREAARHEALGVPAAEARRLAALHLGNAAVVRSNVADVRTTWIDVLWREIRVGIRTLTSTPSFTLPALLVLALGIASTTTILSVLDGVLLRPLPFPAAPELVRVWSRNDERKIVFLSVSPADYEDWRARKPATLRLAAYERPVTVPPEDDHEDPLTVMRVSPDLFALLGVAPALGRGFESADVPEQVAVLSHGIWQRRFGGAADAVGRTMSIGRQTLTIIGVMPARFDVPNAVADVWLPLDTSVAAQDPYAHLLRVLARSSGRADAAVAIQRDLDVIAAQLAEERPGENAGWRVTVLPLFETVVSPELRRSLWITAGAVLFVLLLASTSAAGLVLVRSASRERELAVRVALGASRGSLVRLLLLECLVLAIVAGAMGLAAAAWGMSLLRETGDALIPRLAEVRIDTRVFVATAGLSFVSALLAGVAPAWRSTRSLQERLRQRGLASDPTTGRTLPLLVVVELSTAMLLVVGAALLVQTVRNLHERPLGFDSEHLLSLEVVRSQGIDESVALARIQDALDHLGSTPGVTVVAATSALPFSGQNSGNTFAIEGQAGDGPLPDTDYRVVSPAYFDALGVSLRRGRTFGDTDRSHGVIVLSQTAAERFWPGRDPIGSRVRLGSSDWLTVIGVAGDVRYEALADPSERLRPMMYIPYWQRPDTPLTIVVRTSLEPQSLVDDLRQRWSATAGLRLGRIDTITALLRQASVAQRFSMSLVAAFAGTSVILAAVSLYGLLALLVGRRTREIGVRLALGATRWDVTRLILSRTLPLVLTGVAFGILASGASSRLLQSLLFGVSATDPGTYAAVTVGFLLLGAVASAVPIRRALTVDPVRIINVE